MGRVKVLNTDGIQQVFVAADEATVLANEAAVKALEASERALSAAQQVATVDEMVPAILTIIRAQLGGLLGYNNRGVWLIEASYKKDDFVTFTLPDGSTSAFVAVADVPAGIPPTDVGYWTPLGGVPAETGLELTANLEGALELAPGASAEVQLSLRKLNVPESTEIIFEVGSNEPGLSGVVVAVPEVVTQDELNPDLDGQIEGEGKLSLYTLTVTAGSATPEAQHQLSVTARVAGWVDEPSSPNYALTASAQLNVVAARAVAPGIDPNLTAEYGMSGAASYTLADLLKDSGPNGLHLIRKGDVRPNSRVDGWLCEGTPGSVLHTPALTGHAMNAAQELVFIVPDPEKLADGAVVAALASATVKHNYAYVYKTSAGFVLRSALQNAAGTGAETRDSGAVPLGTRLSISADPVSKLVTLHAIRENKSSSVPLPAWTAAGVVASFYAVYRSDGTVLNPSAGQVLAARPYKVALTAIQRTLRAQELVDAYTARATADAKNEYPSATRLVLEMRKGEWRRDRTFFHGDLIALGDAAQGAEGGLVTTGAAGSGFRTDWMPDVTWEKSFTATFFVTDFFADPLGLAYAALATENNANAWMKLRPVPVTSGGVTRYDAQLVLVPGAGMPGVRGILEDVGKRPAHLIVLRYDVTKRTIGISELFSGKTLAEPLSVPTPNFTGMIGLSLGVVYRGKTDAGVDSGPVESSATRQSGVWLGTKLYAAAEEADALAALGVAAADLGRTTNPPAPVPATSTLVGVQDFSESRLGSGDLKDVFTTYAKPGWLYMSQDKRKDKPGVHIPWDKSYANRYEIKTYNGVSYRSYTGPTCGQFFIGRGTASLSYTAVSEAFRATKDLRILDVACLDVEALTDVAKDESGIGSGEPDGFDGFAFGCNGVRMLFFGPNDSRNTAIVEGGKVVYYNERMGNDNARGATGWELQLEEGLMLAWMVTALGAHQNIDKFSPTYEPVGNRPATPQFYRRVRDKAVALYLDTNAKWDKFWGNSRMSELPMHVRRSLVHSAMNELGAKIAYAKILHGAAWKTSPEYAEVQRAWKMIFGEYEKVGVNPKLQLAFWHEANHPRYGKCIFWGHGIKRYKPSGTKDVTGEYISSDLSTQFPHPNDYSPHDYGAMVFMHEEGCDFVPRSWLEKCANTLLATLQLGEKFVDGGQASPTPYLMNGNNQVEALVSPWGGVKSTKGANRGFLAGGPAASIAAYDTHGELEALVKSHYAKYGGPQTYGATAGLLLAAAKREGRLSL